jgi:hypothetical protein
MEFLNFRIDEVDDRVSSLEAMASTRIDLHAKVMAEAQAVLDWAWCNFPAGHGQVDDGADWDHDVQVLIEDGGWHTVTVTFTGTAPFVDAFSAAFGVVQD